MMYSEFKEGDKYMKQLNWGSVISCKYAESMSPLDQREIIQSQLVTIKEEKELGTALIIAPISQTACN